jgi:hypothetical protein
MKIRLDEVRSAEVGEPCYMVSEEDRMVSHEFTLSQALDPNGHNPGDTAHYVALNALRDHLREHFTATSMPNIEERAKLIAGREKAVDAVREAAELPWYCNQGGHLHWLTGLAIGIARTLKPGDRSEMDRDYQVAIGDLEKVQAWAAEKSL